MRDKNAAHHLGCDAKELRTVNPIDRALRTEPKIRLVYECSRLQRVVGTLFAKETFGEMVQLVVDDGEQRVERCFLGRCAASANCGQVGNGLFGQGMFGKRTSMSRFGAFSGVYERQPHNRSAAHINTGKDPMTARYTSDVPTRNQQQRSLWRHARKAAFYLVIGSLAACEDCEEKADPTRLEVRASASPNEQNVAQGATTTFTVTVRRIGFSGPVSLATIPSTMPAGVTVQFNPSVLTEGVTEATASFSASPTATTVYGSEPPVSIVQYIASGPGDLRDTSDLRARIVPSSQAGITLNVTPGSFSLTKGEMKEGLVTIARQGNYTGPVTVDFKSTFLGVTSTIAPVANVPDTWRVAFTSVNPAPEQLNDAMPFVLEAKGPGLKEATVGVPVFLVRPDFRPVVLHGVSMEPNATDTVTVRLLRSKGFDSPITLAVETAPPGITGTFAPNPAVDDASLLTVRAASTVLPGEYLIRVRGSAPTSSGAADAFTEIGVVVNQPSNGGFTMTAPNMSVVAGNNTSSIFNVTRTGGFTAPIDVEFSRITSPTVTNAPLPSGMTISLDQNPITQNFTTIRLNTALTTPPGTYQLRALGTSVGGRTVAALFTVIVTPIAPQTNVVRMVLEPSNAEITAPARQQFIARLYDATGAVVAVENGATLKFTSSNPAIARIDSDTGIATGIASGTTTITARYSKNGVQIFQEATPLFVYGAGAPGHYGSATMSVAGNVRTIRRGESIMFQIIVRDAAGTAITTGVNPAPVVTSSDPSVVRIDRLATGPVPGYFFDMTAAFGAPIGSEIRIRYDVTGAGGELVMRVVP